MELVEWAFAACGVLLGFGISWLLFSGKISNLRRLASMSETEKNRAIEHAQWFKEQLEASAQEKQALQDNLEKMQTRLTLEFQSIAQKLFDDNTQKFTTQSEQKIGALLHPMQQKLTDFNKLVVDSFTAQGKEQHTLKSEIEKIVLQTDGLTRALRGDVKAQGNWGEIMLERLLEDSGLQQGSGYVIQGTDMKLVGVDGGRQQPDVIVKLPDNKHIIVDAKVTLTAYEQYSNETDEAKRDLYLKDFLRSVRAHVQNLSAKAYQQNPSLDAPDFVCLFMPIEGAYSLAVQKDPALHSYAWERKIVLVCPSTLFATLRTIASLWQVDLQNRHAREIALQAGRLYDKFVGFIDDMKSIGKQSEQLQRAYELAMGKLADGRGNLVSGMEKLRSLGAKNSKSLPPSLTAPLENEEALSD